MSGSTWHVRATDISEVIGSLPSVGSVSPGTDYVLMEYKIEELPPTFFD